LAAGCSAGVGTPGDDLGRGAGSSPGGAGGTGAKGGGGSSFENGGSAGGDSSGGGTGGGTCPSVGAKLCPNDSAVTQSDVDACNKAASDSKCGSQYTAFIACAEANVSGACGSDGKTDG